MKTFVQTLYNYNFVETVSEDNSDEEDEIAVGIKSDLHLLASSWWPANRTL